MKILYFEDEWWPVPAYAEADESDKYVADIPDHIVQIYDEKKGEFWEAAIALREAAEKSYEEKNGRS